MSGRQGLLLERRRHLRIEGLCELDRGQSDSRSTSVDEDFASGLHLGNEEERLPCREPVLRNGGGLFPRDVVGLAGAHARGNGDIFGICAASSETEPERRESWSALHGPAARGRAWFHSHRIALFEVARTGFFDRSTKLDAENGRSSRRERVHAAA